MKFAIVDEQRLESAPGLSGTCPVCEAQTIAKCGEKYIWHWAHKRRRDCDHWWENETEWHRNWKNYFPVEWQEIVQHADDGEKHIADVKTEQGIVIEFQHSHIKPEERRSREDFYGKMVWVVDGLRRKNDLKQFIEAVKCGTQISHAPLVVEVFHLSGRLLKDWATSPVPIVFDFGNQCQPQGIWLLVPVGLDDTMYLALITKGSFISETSEGTFDLQLYISDLKRYIQGKRRR